MALLGELIVKIGADIGNFTSGMEKVAEQAGTTAEETGTKLEEMGKSAKHASDGIMGMVKSSLSFAAGQAIYNSATQAVGYLKDQFMDCFTVASDAQAAMAQTNQVLSSTHDISGETAANVEDLATKLSMVTKFSKDTVMSSEDMLLTFTNIGKNVFPQATTAVLDMSQALGQDTKSSAIQLGKALDDPIKGITALSRVGVTFSAGQKTAIAAMVAAGNTAGAQKLILKELTTEFGGSAIAAGKTFPGMLAILQNKLTAVKETVGNAMLPQLQKLLVWFESPQIQDFITAAIPQLVAVLLTTITVIANLVTNGAKFVQWLSNSSAGATAFKIGLAAVALIMGTFQIATMVSSLIAMAAGFNLAGVSAAFAAIGINLALWPIALVVLGIAALIAVIILVVTHWKQITDFLSTTFGPDIKKAGEQFSEMGTVFHNVINAIGNFFSGLGTKITSTWDTITGATKTASTNIGTSVGGAFNNMGTSTHNTLTDMQAAFKQVWTQYVPIVLSTMNSMGNAVLSGMNAVKGFFINIATQTIAPFKALWQTFAPFFSGLFTLLFQIFVALLGKIQSYVLLWVTTIKNFIVLWFNFLYNFWKVLFTNLYNVIFKPIFDLIYKYFILTITNWKNNTVAVFTDIYNFLKVIWQGVYDFIAPLVNNLYNLVVKTFNDLESNVNDIFTTVLGDATSAWSAVYNTITTFVTSARRDVSNIFTGARNDISTLFSQTESIVVSIWGSIYNAINNKVNAIRDALLAPFRAAGSMISSIVKSMANLIVDQIDNIMKTINNFTGAISTGVNDVAGLLGVAKKPFGTNIQMIPHFATGTDNAPGGLALVGEKGPELIQLPQGSSVATAAQTAAALSATLSKAGKASGVMDIDQYIGTNNIKAVPISKPLSGSSVGNSSKGDSAKGGGGNSNPFGWLSDIWSWFSKGAGAIYNQVLGSIGQKMPNLPGGAFQQEMTGVGGLIGNTVKTWLGNVMATVTPPSVGGGNMGYTGTFNPNAKLVTAGASQIIPNADATYGFYGENIIGGAHGWHGWMTDSTLAHAGMDFTSPHGTPVHEFIGGTVEEAANTAWGGEVGVDIGHGMHERYLHLIDMAVKVGQFIKRGTLLGHSGGDTVATGLGTWSNGAHLHYEVDGGIAAGQGGRGQNWYPPSVWNAFGLKNPFDFSPAGLGGGNTSSTPVSSPGGGAKGNWGAIVDWLHSTVDPLPYVWGGGGPNGYDCSGLAGEVWNRVTGHPSYHRVMRAGQGAAYYDGPGINVDGWPGYNMKPGLTNNGFNIAVTSGHMWGQIAGCGFEAANPNMGILIGNQATGMNTGAAHYTYTGMANGGIINEKILGVGASGKRYAFGESGPERIIPNTTSNGGNARGGSCNCDELADKIVSAMKGMSIKMDGNKVGQVVIDAARLRGLKI